MTHLNMTSLMSLGSVFIKNQTLRKITKRTLKRQQKNMGQWQETFLLSKMDLNPVPSCNERSSPCHFPLASNSASVKPGFWRLPLPLASRTLRPVCCCDCCLLSPLNFCPFISLSYFLLHLNLKKLLFSGFHLSLVILNLHTLKILS